MKYRSKRNSWLITIPLSVVGVGYLYFFFLPAKKEIAHLRQELKTKRDFVTSNASLGTTIFETEQKIAKAKDHLNAWRKDSPTTDELSRLFGEISRKTKAAGTTMYKFNPETITSMNAVSRVPLSLGAEGTFEQIFAMLEGLEELPATIWIESLRFEAAGDSGQEMSTEASLVIFAENSEISN